MPPDVELTEIALQNGLAPWELAEHMEWYELISARTFARNRYRAYLAEKQRRAGK